MTQQIVIQSPAVNRKEPLLLATAMGVKDEKEMIRNRDRIGEVAGGTAAECAAVCCCCPCAMVHLLVLAVYKVPTGLCKKALKKNKRKRLLGRKKNKNSSSLEKNQRMTMGKKSEMITSDEKKSDGIDGGDHEKVVGVIDAVDRDPEMWDGFYGAGFWRSSSQRED